jgi:hypothetical protein
LANVREYWSRAAVERYNLRFCHVLCTFPYCFFMNRRRMGALCLSGGFARLPANFRDLLVCAARDTLFLSFVL